MVAENIKTDSRRAELLEGAILANKIKQEVKSEIDRLVETRAMRPALAAVRVGDDPASAVYVNNKIRACEEVGIRSEHHALPASITQDELLSLIQTLNSRRDIHGILVQLPLPKALVESEIIEAVSPHKDVDGFHPVNVGKL